MSTNRQAQEAFNKLNPTTEIKIHDPNDVLLAYAKQDVEFTVEYYKELDKYIKHMKKKTFKERHEPTNPDLSLFPKKPDPIRVIGMSYAYGTTAQPEMVNATLKVYWQKPQLESSQIAGYCYDDDSKTLALKFVKGGIYTYKNVDRDTYLTLASIDFTKTESLGAWIHKNITRKDSPYPFKSEN